MHGEAGVPWVELAWFAGWLAAILVLFALGVRAPLQTRLSRVWAAGYNVGIVVAAVAVAALGNVALARHDAQIDLTRERAFTPSPQAEAVATVAHAGRPAHVLLSRGRSERPPRQGARREPRSPPPAPLRAHRRSRQAAAARGDLRRAPVQRGRARGRRPPHPGARDGRRRHRARHPAAPAQERDDHLLHRGARRVSVRQLRVPYPRGDAAGAHATATRAPRSCRCPGTARGACGARSRASASRPGEIVTATLSRIPDDCAVVVAVNPRTTYLPAESDVLADYLARGGSALFLVRPRLRGRAAARRAARQARRAPRAAGRHRSARPLLDRPRVRGRARLRAARGHRAHRPHLLSRHPADRARAAAPGRHGDAALREQQGELRARRAAGRGAPARRGRARARRRRCAARPRRGDASSASPSRARGRGQPPMRPRGRSAR